MVFLGMVDDKGVYVQCSNRSAVKCSQGKGVCTQCSNKVTRERLQKMGNFPLINDWTKQDALRAGTRDETSVNEVASDDPQMWSVDKRAVDLLGWCHVDV